MTMLIVFMLWVLDVIDDELAIILFLIAFLLDSS